MKATPRRLPTMYVVIINRAAWLNLEDKNNDNACKYSNERELHGYDGKIPG